MATQNAQMLEKIAVVDEVQTRLRASAASIVSEYRGLSVAELAQLRDALASAGGDYRVFKNTLVRRAIDGGEYQPLGEYLSGPTALTFVEGDISAVAKALRDFARANPLLVIKGGLADGSLLSSADLAALAELPPREVLLARLAGALAAPMQQMAALLQALPQNLAYGISALIEERGGVPESAPTVADEETKAVAEAVAEEAPAEDEAPAAAEVAEANEVAEAETADPETETAEPETEGVKTAETAAETPEAEAAPEAEVAAEAEAAPEAEAPVETVTEASDAADAPE
jgi:large subunit ribosomal protein L10